MKKKRIIVVRPMPRKQLLDACRFAEERLASVEMALRREQDLHAATRIRLQGAEQSQRDLTIARQFIGESMATLSRALVSDRGE